MSALPRDTFPRPERYPMTRHPAVELEESLMQVQRGEELIWPSPE
jgi:hypothetical protein